MQLFRRRFDADSPFAAPDRLQELIRSEEPYQLVDVRTPEEYARGHLPTARLIPHMEIIDRPPTADREMLIVVYCHSGIRSRYAKDVLVAAGYLNVVNFGGAGRWRGELEFGQTGDTP